MLARNDTAARAIVQWWASLGEGGCPPDTRYAEQDCAQMAVERSRRPWVHEWRGWSTVHTCQGARPWG